MILALIAIAAAIGFNYVYLDRIYDMATKYYPNPPQLLVAMTGAIWQIATAFAFYTPLCVMGLQGTMTLILSIFISGAVWPHCVYPHNILNTFTMGFRVMLLTTTWRVLYLVADSTAPTALQILVASVALVAAWFVDGFVERFAQQYAPLETVAVRVATYPLVVVICHFMLMVLIDTCYDAPMRMALHFICGVATPKLMRFSPITTNFHFMLNIAISTIAAGLIEAAWFWPVHALAATLALMYTTILIRSGGYWHDSEVPIQWKTASFGLIYLGVLLTTITVYRCPIMLAPLPLLLVFTATAPATKPHDDVPPTLQELQTAYEYHSVDWTITSHSHRVGLDTRVGVPRGEEATWHRHAANYYREVLSTQYFIDKVVAPVSSPQVPAAEPAEIPQLDELNLDYDKKMESIIN